MISDALAVLTTSQDGEPGLDVSTDNSLLQTNKEFLDFLEIQSKTQVKILEVEVKAGQELMRLLKAQHQQERKEVRHVHHEGGNGCGIAGNVCVVIRVAGAGGGCAPGHLHGD